MGVSAKKLKINVDKGRGCVHIDLTKATTAEEKTNTESKQK